MGSIDREILHRPGTNTARRANGRSVWAAGGPDSAMTTRNVTPLTAERVMHSRRRDLHAIGIWKHPAGREFAIFSGSYPAVPVNEIITVSATFTAVSCLRYFRNGSGQTLSSADRSRCADGGIHTVPKSGIGIPSKEWQQDLLDRAYFSDGVYGTGTDRARPRPRCSVAPQRQSGSGKASVYITPDARVVTTEDIRLPPAYPVQVTSIRPRAASRNACRDSARHRSSCPLGDKIWAVHQGAAVTQILRAATSDA